MPIPDGREDAVEAIKERYLWLGPEHIPEIVDLVAGILQFTPMGDNHHNAAVCPYCRPNYEREVDRAASKLRLAVVSPEVTRDLADQIWEIAEGRPNNRDASRTLKEISERVRRIRPVK